MPDEPEVTAPAPVQVEPPKETPGDDILDAEGVAAIFSYDPFKDADAAAAVEAPKTPETPPVVAAPVPAVPPSEAPVVLPEIVAPTPAVAPAVAPVTVPVVKPVETPPETPPVDPAIAAMKGQVDALTRQNELLQKVVLAQQTKDPVAAPAAAAAAPPQQQYLFDIPDDIVGAMAHEESSVRKRGIQALVAGVGQAVHDRIIEQVSRQTSEMINARVSDGINRNATQNEIARDFYTAYPQFNQPHLKPIVAQVATAAAQELGHQNWNPALRDEVARRLQSLAVNLAPVAPAVPAPSAPAGKTVVTAPARVPATPRPPVQFGGNTSPLPAVNAGIEADIYDTLFGHD